MYDPRKKRYFYLMMAGFGAISMSILLFFLLDRMRGIGEVLDNLLDILSPFIYGGVVAYLLRPLCNFYESFFVKHLPAPLKRSALVLAVVCGLITLLIVVYALLAMILPQVYDSVVTLGKTIPSRVENFINWAESTFGQDERMDVYFDYFNTSYEKLYLEVESFIREMLVPQISTLVSGVGSSAFKILRSLYNLLVGLIVAVYVLFSRKRFARQGTLIVRSMFTEKWASAILNEISLVDRMFGGFIDAKILDSAIIGGLCYIGCSILRMPNTLLISVFIGVTNVIPFFGPLIGAVPSTLLILIDSPLKAVWFVIFVLVLQQVDGNLIGPRIMGNKIGISGFWVMFAIIFFGGTFGLVGMIVGVPLFAVLYDLVRKLVKNGLRKRGKLEVWEQYIADYPNDDLMEHKHPKEKAPSWTAAEWKEYGLQLLDTVKKFGCRVWRWLVCAWAFIAKWAVIIWKFLSTNAKKCWSKLCMLAAKARK